MKKRAFHLSLLCILLGLTQCKKYVYEPPIIATVINNSDLSLFMIMVDGDNPDTINLNDRLVTDFIDDYTPPKTKGHFDYLDLTRDEYIAQHPIQQIFIGDAQKLEAAKWKIRPEFILRHFEADRRWYEVHDWTITYPQIKSARENRHESIKYSLSFGRKEEMEYLCTQIEQLK